MKLPFDDDFDIFENEYGAKQPNFGGISPKMLGLFKEEGRNRESKVVPDITGADKYFIDGFITGEMAEDFWLIARDFMKHHFPRLREFSDLAVYGNDMPEKSDPEGVLQNKILNVMYNTNKFSS